MGKLNEVSLFHSVLQLNIFLFVAFQSQFGPDKYLSDKELNSVISLLPTFQVGAGDSVLNSTNIIDCI